MQKYYANFFLLFFSLSKENRGFFVSFLFVRWGDDVNGGRVKGFETSHTYTHPRTHTHPHTRIRTRTHTQKRQKIRTNQTKKRTPPRKKNDFRKRTSNAEHIYYPINTGI